MGRLQEQLDHRNAWDLDSQLEQAMDALRCPPPDADVSVLSGGERRRVALCTLLLQQPDLLLLDEPTNHLDAESVQWLEQHVEKHPGTVVAVTHDPVLPRQRGPVDPRARPRPGLPLEGNYSTYLETKAALLTIEGRKDAKRKKRLQDELEWVHSGPKARQAKCRARLRRYEEMATEAEMTRKLDFEEIQIPPGPRLGTLVVEADRLTKGFGERFLIDDLSFTAPHNGIVGVIGPNGVGKTALFKMIVGEERPDAGRIRVGDTVRISYVDQTRARIDPDKSAWELISGGHRLHHGRARRDALTRVRRRLRLQGPGPASAGPTVLRRRTQSPEPGAHLKQGGNLLLLDEPTNDLDAETLSSLKNALLDFPGCAVITAHDRWLPDRIATHILAREGNDENPARWLWFEGNFEAYEKNNIDRLGADAIRPHRVTYRKLTRD